MAISKKKKILIVVPSFSIGGTIVSLHSLLSVIDTTKYEIDVFALSRDGAYLDKMPNCSVLPENVWLSMRCRNVGLLKRVINNCLRVIRALFRKHNWSIEPFLCRLANRKFDFKKYDTVVNFSESIANVVCHYPARNPIAWVHCDYQRYLMLVNRDEAEVYEKFNTIVCVSEYTRSKFCDCLPKMAARTIAIHNVINVEAIIKKSEEPIDDDRFVTDMFTIVSAGRLDPVKQFHLIPNLAAEIKKRTDKKFVWYIIGGDRGFESYADEIKKDIVECGVANEVVLLGEKGNIYPYMAKANLYVSTSLSEAFPLVINEAKALGIPIVSNNFGSAAESIEDGVDGFIVSVKNGMSKRISELIAEQVSLPLKEQNSHDTSRAIVEQVERCL